MEDFKTLPHLPQSLGELSAEWLSSALGILYPGTEVTSVYLGTVIHGTNTKARLLLTYNEAGHAHRLPATMFVKCGFEKHSQQVVDCVRSEAVFYRERAPEGLINAPKCYFALADEKSGKSFLVLEDLLARNVTFGSAARAIEPKIALKALEMLARFHARWWNCGVTPRPYSASANIVTDVWMDTENFEYSKQLPRWEYVPPQLQDRDAFLNAFYWMWESNARQTPCLLHGDLALGNCFFEADGSPGFLDGQGDTFGCWAHDYTVFLLTSLKLEDRRNFERPFLEFYLEQLRSCGVDAPGFEDAWRQYRRNTFWTATAAVLPVEFQPEFVCTAYTQRAMAAVMDLDALTTF